jgi:hypothetical protein
MLPPVFSRQHILAHQLRKSSMSESKIEPLEDFGNNMLNITFFNCVSSKLVEIWLSIDRDVTSDDVSLWKEASQFDAHVLELLQKLTLSCRKPDHFESFFNDSLTKIHAKAKKLQRDEAAKRKTFVADYKAKSNPKSNTLKPGKLPRLRLLNEIREIEKSVFSKGRNFFLNGSLHNHQGEFWHGLLSFVHEPFQLLNCNNKFPHGNFMDGSSLDFTHRKMDMISSWFLPIASVYEIGSRENQPSEPPIGRLSASYGAVPRGLKNPNCISSRMSVKPLRCNIDVKKAADRLHVQWCCDSTDSQALTRNCFAVSRSIFSSCISFQYCSGNNNSWI